MNDPLTPLTDDDLSAHLDGEGGPDVAARLAADPGARSRLEQLRTAAAAVREAPVPPLEPSLVDQLVTRALEAPASEGDHPPAPGDAVVAPLGTRRRADPQWLVAAVVLVLVAAGLALVWSGTRGGGADDTATSAATAERQVDEAAPESAVDGAGSAAGGDTAADADSGGSASSPTTLGPEAGLGYAGDGVALPDLGTFETSELLRSSLAAAFPADAATATATSSGQPITEVTVERCAGLLQEVLPVDGDPTHTGVARIGQETVLVYEFTASADPDASTTTVAGAPATTLTTAVRPAACDPLFVFQR